jgi:hypothetical protein
MAYERWVTFSTVNTMELLIKSLNHTTQNTITNVSFQRYKVPPHISRKRDGISETIYPWPMDSLRRSAESAAKVTGPHFPYVSMYWTTWHKIYERKINRRKLTTSSNASCSKTTLMFYVRFRSSWISNIRSSVTVDNQTMSIWYF